MSPIPETAPITTVVLDLDGTLVDSAYVHTLAWAAAFRAVGVTVPSYRLHRLIGMGGDKFVIAAAGQVVEDSVGDELRARHQTELDALFHRITPTDGAVELLLGLRDRGLSVVLASSGDRETTDRLLDLLGSARAVLDASVTGSDAEHSKPAGDILEVALAEVEADSAVVIGDAVWDVLAAQDAELPCIGLLTGGFSAAELREAGAVDVVETPRALAERLESGAGLF